MEQGDAVALAAGAAGWVVAIPVVQFAGSLAKNEQTPNKLLVLGLGFVISLATTPLIGYFLGWKTRASRIRGIALALGMAQTIDGVVHMFHPEFYSADKVAAHYASSSIFFGAGVLGIASVFS
jgi:uncharacterized oligopeptide transporter (OPT) family protein